MFLMLAVMLPAFLLAMYEKDGLPGGKGAEKHHTDPVSAARSQALSDTKHLRPLCRTVKRMRKANLKPSGRKKPQRLKTAALCPPSRRSPMWRCTRTGVCSSPGGLYTKKTVEYEDINYSVASTEDQTAIFGGWSSFLNYFDSSRRSSFPLSTAAPTPGAAIR